MRTIRTKVYKFNELSEPAKQKAIEWFLNGYPDHYWWESVYDDAKNVGLKITGFDIDRGYCKGQFISSAIDTALKIVDEHGKTCDTYKTSLQFSKEWDELVKKHSDGVKLDEVAEDNEWDFDNEADELEKDFLQSILEDYRIILSKEYDYLTSYEHAAECITINEYEFTKDGNRF